MSLQTVCDQINELVPKMHGWCPVEKACSMAEMIFKNRPDVVVEIGVYAGRSLLPMALACKDIGHGMVYGIDPWSPAASLENYAPTEERHHAYWGEKMNYEYLYEHTKWLLAKHQVTQFAALIRESSETAYKAFTRIDMLHIDGNHSNPRSCRDVELYVPKVPSGGVIYFDDINWASTQEAVGRLRDLGTVFSNAVGWMGLVKK